MACLGMVALDSEVVVPLGSMESLSISIGVYDYEMHQFDCDLKNRLECFDRLVCRRYYPELMHALF